MLIEDTEALKKWLIIVLEPLCDADSSALARYVLALLKKDKQERELKKVMVEQLDVFLSEQTKPFVDRLFDAINSEEYLKAVSDSAAYMHENKKEFSKSKSIKSENQETNLIDLKYSNWTTINSDLCMESSVAESNENNKIDVSRFAENKGLDKDAQSECSILNILKTEPSTNPVESAETYKDRSVSPQTPRTNADKENQPREYRRRFAPIKSRSRSWSRDRSSERSTRRSRSKDRRTTEREKCQRQFKTKSPNNDGRQTHSYERRRSGSDRRRGGTTGGDRSPRFSSGVDSRKGTMRNRSQSRSRSTSLERQAHVSKSTGTDVSPSKKSRNSPESHNANPTTNIRQRCRDFDEKGYCVRGETCPWDHGINPVVFEGVNNPSLLTMSLREYNPDAPDLWSATSSSISLTSSAPSALGVSSPGINPFTGAMRPGSIMATAAGQSSNSSVGISSADYSRSSAGSGFRPTNSMLPFSFNSTIQAPLQRELIPIPVIDVSPNSVPGSTDMNAPVKRRFDSEESITAVDGPSKRKIPVNSRLGSRITNTQGNSSLELRKIPRGLNTIAHLNNHFAKFGKIINIQISYDGDPEAAIITFSNHAEANVAYRSTEAVLNNRFIKVFWHNQETNVPSDMTPITSVRKSQYHLNNVAPVQPINTESQSIVKADVLGENSISPTATSENTPIIASHVTPNSIRHKTSTSRILPNPTVLRKKQEQAKAVVQLANGLRKRKQELLQSYLKQMKSALELVERVEPNDPQRMKTLETIKSLQDSIDKLRKEIAAEQEHLHSQMQNQVTVSSKKTKEQAKKELLDIELELFAQQQEGNDTTAIQKRLDDLQKSLGIGLKTTAAPGVGLKGSVITTKSPNFFSRGSRSRFSDIISTKVDRRPKSIIVTGFTKEEVESVLVHMKLFGEVVKHDLDEVTLQLTIHYTSRINAEQAMLRGKSFKDKSLEISWNVGINSLPSAASLSNELLSTDNSAAEGSKSSPTLEISSVKTEESTNIDALPELNLEDEEEEDESEDRSWRR